MHTHTERCGMTETTWGKIWSMSVLHWTQLQEKERDWGSINIKKTKLNFLPLGSFFQRGDRIWRCRILPVFLMMLVASTQRGAAHILQISQADFRKSDCCFPWLSSHFDELWNTYKEMKLVGEKHSLTWHLYCVVLFWLESEVMRWAEMCPLGIGQGVKNPP